MPRYIGSVLNLLTVSVPSHASGNGDRIILDRFRSCSILLNNESINSCGFTPSISNIPLILSLADVQISFAKSPSFGAFVELQDHIDGLVHISQISEERIEKIKDSLNIGDEVTARVIKIDREERRIGLSIKAANYDEEQLAAETQTYDNMKDGGDLMNLGDILDQATK